jgi:hypothetical protein
VSQPVPGRPGSGVGAELAHSVGDAPTVRPGDGLACHCWDDITSLRQRGSAGLRRTALDGTHGMQRRVPPVVVLHPRPASRPGPAQGAPGDWGCRHPTTRAQLLRLTQDGVDFGEQRDFLGNRPRFVPSPICWVIAVRRRRSALPRRARWLDDRQHLTGRSSVADLLSHDGGELVVIGENVAAYQHGSHLHTSISIELA